MVLIAFQDSDDDLLIITKEWHVGEKTVWAVPANFSCIRLQATGQELNAIRRVFSTIPMHDGMTVIWSGPFSQFIWDNWSMLEVRKC